MFSRPRDKQDSVVNPETSNNYSKQEVARIFTVAVQMIEASLPPKYIDPVESIDAIQAIFIQKFKEYIQATRSSFPFFGLMASSSDGEDNKDIDEINMLFLTARQDAANRQELSSVLKTLFTGICKINDRLQRVHLETTVGGRLGWSKDSLSMKITEAINQCLIEGKINQVLMDQIHSETSALSVSGPSSSS
jgi:hypothetical protein